ncbi:MAG: GNAT family N-acetyltransferase [Lachnospiraceae bacterium]|nr:GNAT family N-acetyltransferase [Lachnospiraceae bacterium]
MFPELKTSQCILRKVKLDDAEAIFRNWASNHEITRWLSWKPHTSIEQTKLKVNEWMHEDETQSIHWIVTMNGSDEPIGCVSVSMGKSSPGIFGYGHCLCKRVWDHGIATECMRAVLHEMFINRNMIGCYTNVDRPNIGSIRVMEKNGLSVSRVLQYKGLDNLTGEKADVLVFATIRERYIRMNGEI